MSIRAFSLFLCLFLISGIGAAQNEPPEYVGNEQFFDLSGVWVSNSTEKRVSKLIIKKTIVNTYRIATYMTFNGQEQIFNKWEPFNVSEDDLCFVHEIAGATSYIMPMWDAGEQKILLYSMISDPDGGWIDMKKDIFTRQYGGVQRPNATVGLWQMEGYWKNELPSSQVFSRLHIEPTTTGHTFHFYKVVSDKERYLGKKNLLKTEGSTQHVKWFNEDRDVYTTAIITPIMKNNKLEGIDMVVEEVYSDLIPKKVFRQFFVNDPDASHKEEVSESIKTLEGTWLNLDDEGATNKLVIEDGDMEIFVNCEEGLCAVGKSPLEWQKETEMIGNVTNRVLSWRITELEYDLDVNKNRTKPIVIAVDTTIEFFDENKDIEVYTEIFIRKNEQISPAMYDLTSQN